MSSSRGGPAGAIHYPDLQTLPPSDIGIEYDSITSRKLLRFSTTIANLGEGPLEIIPTNNAASGTTDAYQRFYTHDDQGNWSVATTAYVGTFVFHPQHDHWHLEDFARYELRDVAVDGSAGSTVLAFSEKVSFCLTDSELIGASGELAGTAAYMNCGRTDAQGISAGWADVYEWYLYGQSLDITGLPDGDYWLILTVDPDNFINEGGGVLEVNNTGAFKVRIASERVWIDDALPAAAIPDTAGDSWTWVASDPAPVSGSLAHQSDPGPGLHQHSFNFTTDTLALNPGNVLFAYVYLDPANPPREVMLEWTDGYFSVSRGYWGENLIDVGVPGTASRRYVGPLPPPGQWARLEVPVDQLDLAGVAISGMSFTAFDGRATWDSAGVQFAPDLLPPEETGPPLVAITAPANNATVSGVVVISADVSGDLGLATVQFQVDGANLGAAMTAPPYSVSWDSSLNADGPHTLTAVARDATGQDAVSSAVSVTVRNHRPPTLVVPPPTTLTCSPPGGIEAVVSVAVGNPGRSGWIALWTVDGVDVQTNSIPVSALPSSFPFTCTHIYAPGVHVVRITVSDGEDSASDETTVTVEADHTPPLIDFPAQVVVPTDPGSCSAAVDYPVAASDNCSGATLVCEPPANSLFPTGTTTVRCTARDGAGNSSACSFQVVVEDVEAPLVTRLSASPEVLWPPDHALVPVTVTAEAADNCGEPDFRIIAVNSNEPLAEAPGTRDGEAWELIGPMTVNLRAERTTQIGERIYAITVECRDRAGNRAVHDVNVRVPLSPSQ